MLNFTKFRADRLREAMKENEVTFQDIVDGFGKILKKKLKQPEKHWLLDIIDGADEPSINDIYKICFVVNCSADYLLGLSDEMY